MSVPVDNKSVVRDDFVLEGTNQDQIVHDAISNKERLIVQWICYAVLSQVISIFGTVTNVINIVCFIKHGFKDAINISLLGLSISDLCSLVTLSWVNICYTPTFQELVLPFDQIDTPVLTGAWPHMTFTRITSSITAFITLERCMCVTMPLKVKRLITPRRVTAIIISMYAVLIAAVSPVYVVNSFGIKFSPTRNRTLVGLTSMGNRRRVEDVFFAVSVFVPICSFVIVIVCTLILVRNLRITTKWREKSTSSAQFDHKSHRDKKLTMMVTMISVIFIVCFFPICVIVLAMILVPQLSLYSTFINTLIVTGSVGMIMESTNSASNCFIYYHMSSKYRDICCKIFWW